MHKFTERGLELINTLYSDCIGYFVCDLTSDTVVQGLYKQSPDGSSTLKRDISGSGYSEYIDSFISRHGVVDGEKYRSMVTNEKLSAQFCRDRERLPSIFRQTSRA